MTATRTRSNRARGQAYRNEVVLWLQDHGFPAARPRPVLTDESRADRDELDRGDIEGLPFVLNVRTEATIDFSGGLNEARRTANALGVNQFAIVRHRLGYDVRDSYVTLPLELLPDVMDRYRDNS